MKPQHAIEVNNLVKEYRIRREGEYKYFRALDDISFSLEKGKVLGVVGQNGAGKSTLLKILSRITYPTSGEAMFRGSLSSLLEVGTGFHPELSGRENIFLNGNILGMTRKQIRKRFDEIVDFSGIEEFIDTPVKHYSSGMYVRLAFSVAANLSPDILLIDEVLAVGDTAFQQKCLQRTDQARKEEGRTIIFLSHNMSAIRKLCDEVIWLHEGKIMFRGLPEETTFKYLREFESIARQTPIAERKDRIGTGEVYVTGLKWEAPEDVLISGRPAVLHIRYHSKSRHKISGLNFRMNVFKDNGEYLTTLSNEMVAQPLSEVPASGEVHCHFDSLPFLEGSYYMISNLFVSSVRNDQVDRAMSFKVLAGNLDKAGARRTAVRAGIRVEQNWSISRP